MGGGWGKNHVPPTGPREELAPVLLHGMSNMGGRKSNGPTLKADPLMHRSTGSSAHGHSGMLNIGGKRGISPAPRSSPVRKAIKALEMGLCRGHLRKRICASLYLHFAYSCFQILPVTWFLLCQLCILLPPSLHPDVLPMRCMQYCITRQGGFQLQPAGTCAPLCPDHPVPLPRIIGTRVAREASLVISSSKKPYTEGPEDEEAIACETIESVGSFATYFIPIAYMVVFLLDLLGNGLVMYVLTVRRSPWLLADHYLFQLALSDLLLGLTLPFWAFQYSFHWIIGDIPCKILGALYTINIYSTIFFLVSISINRYFSIVHAIELHKKQRPLHTVFICIFIWVFSCTLSWQELHFRKSEGSFCTYNFPLGQSTFWRVVLQLLELAIGFILPLVFMVYSYSRIFCTLQRSRHNHSRRSQMVIIVLLLVFVFCWTPYKALQLVDSLQRLKIISRDCYLEKILDIGMIVTEALGLSHVCINPIVYAFVGVKFRREIFKVFKRLSNQVFHSTVVISRDGTIFTDSNCSYSRIM
ncbi:PREDICTED: C-X-C chemokine receptor type 3-like [Nanorana parkeri]|uniref:C-X-C chemokine receptor type 3-like n=1 Tax=Nanorana parkeri TaxID=125878 RepID=UPI000854E84C|nr:PREDICTED: C-X-C chemokine receptor type 3-like [Nanorana parkeri]